MVVMWGFEFVSFFVLMCESLRLILTFNGCCTGRATPRAASHVLSGLRQIGAQWSLPDGRIVLPCALFVLCISRLRCLPKTTGVVYFAMLCSIDLVRVPEDLECVCLSYPKPSFCCVQVSSQRPVLFSEFHFSALSAYSAPKISNMDADDLFDKKLPTQKRVDMPFVF